MISEPTVYPILNDSFSPGLEALGPTTFPAFKHLPLEIRTQIWAEFLTMPRFMELQLDNSEGDKDVSELCHTSNELGNFVSGYPYCIFIPNHVERLSNSLRLVNHEAHTVFHQIRRIAIPVMVWSCRPHTVLVHLNPDANTIWITCTTNSLTSIMIASFLHDMVAYDPQGVGLTQMALGEECGLDRSMLASLLPNELPPPIRKSMFNFAQTNLEAFYCLIPAGSESRNMVGAKAIRKLQVHHNRSIPVFSHTQSYSIFKQDPRPIETDLMYITIFSDPRRTVFLFNRFLANFGRISLLNPSYLLTLRPSILPEDGITDRDQLLGYLEDYEEEWNASTATLDRHIWGDVVTQAEYETQSTTLPDAVGLWKFPPKTFGKVPKIEEERYMRPRAWSTGERIKDLSEFHPELWALDLD